MNKNLITFYVKISFVQTILNRLFYEHYIFSTMCSFNLNLSFFSFVALHLSIPVPCINYIFVGV